MTGPGPLGCNKPSKGLNGLLLRAPYKIQTGKTVRVCCSTDLWYCKSHNLKLVFVQYHFFLKLTSCSITQTSTCIFVEKYELCWVTFVTVENEFMTCGQDLVIQYTMHPTAPATSYLTNSLLHMFRHQHQLSKASRTKTDLFLLHILTRTCFLHVCRKRSPITDIIDVSLCKQHLPQRRWACPWKETLLLYSWYTTAPGGWGQWHI